MKEKSSKFEAAMKRSPGLCPVVPETAGRCRPSLFQLILLPGSAYILSGLGILNLAERAAAVAAALVLGFTRYLLAARRGPSLTITDTHVILHQRSRDPISCCLFDLSVPTGTVSVLLAIVALLVLGSGFHAIAISMVGQPIQAKLLHCVGLCFDAGAVSLGWLDFPRRKVLIPNGATKTITVFLENRCYTILYERFSAPED